MPHCIFLWCSRYPIRPFHKKRAKIVCVLLCLLRLSYILRSTQFYLRCQFITIVNLKPFVYIRAGLNYIFWIEMRESWGERGKWREIYEVAGWHQVSGRVTQGFGLSTLFMWFWVRKHKDSGEDSKLVLCRSTRGGALLHLVNLTS